MPGVCAILPGRKWDGLMRSLFPEGRSVISVWRTPVAFCLRESQSLDISDRSDYNSDQGFSRGQSVRISGIIWLEDIVEKLYEKHGVRQEEVRETKRCVTGQFL